MNKFKCKKWLINFTGRPALITKKILLIYENMHISICRRHRFKVERHTESNINLVEVSRFFQKGKTNQANIFCWFLCQRCQIIRCLNEISSRRDILKLPHIKFLVSLGKNSMVKNKIQFCEWQDTANSVIWATQTAHLQKSAIVVCLVIYKFYAIV